MNISLPEPLKKFVDGQVKQGGYSGAADYVRDLIRDHQQHVASEQLRTLIAEGLASGAPVPADKKYWQRSASNCAREQAGHTASAR